MSKSTIVVGFDGSIASQRALAYAQELASCLKAGIRLVHVIDWSPFEFQTQQENESRSRERRDQLEKDRNELFPPILQGLKSAGIDASATVLWGHPAEALTAEARTQQAAMIVIGRTGRSGLKNLLFGSIASRTVQLADLPVLVIP